MSELSYKELQEKGIFDVPYRAFEYMQSQQAEIDELQKRIDEALKILQEMKHNGAYRATYILKGKTMTDFYILQDEIDIHAEEGEKVCTIVTNRRYHKAFLELASDASRPERSVRYVSCPTYPDAEERLTEMYYKELERYCGDD